MQEEQTLSGQVSQFEREQLRQVLLAKYEPVLQVRQDTLFKHDPQFYRQL